MQRYFFNFSILCLLTGCSFDQNDYFPLEAGLTWSYQMHYETMDGAWTIPYVVSNIANTKNNSGERVYLRKGLNGREYLYQFDTFGLKLLHRSRNRHDSVNPVLEEADQYVFQIPIEKGKRWSGVTNSQTLIKTGPPWKTEFRIVTAIPVESHIESVNEKVSVAAGEFKNCMKIHLQGAIHYDAGNYVGLTLIEVNEDRWYCPNVGLVKTLRVETTTDETVTKGMLSLELEEFRSS